MRITTKKRWKDEKPLWTQQQTLVNRLPWVAVVPGETDWTLWVLVSMEADNRPHQARLRRLHSDGGSLLLLLVQELAKLDELVILIQWIPLVGDSHLQLLAQEQDSKRLLHPTLARGLVG